MNGTHMQTLTDGSRRQPNGVDACRTMPRCAALPPDVHMRVKVPASGTRSSTAGGSLASTQGGHKEEGAAWQHMVPQLSGWAASAGT